MAVKKPRGKSVKGHAKKVAGKASKKTAKGTAVKSKRRKKTVAAHVAAVTPHNWPLEAKPAATTREQVPLASIAFDDENQRLASSGSQDDIGGLAETIRLQGLLQPIRVRRLKKPMKGGKRHVVVFGHRRVLACRHLGWESIDAFVIEESDGVVDSRAVENVQHKGLSPLEESIAVGQMLAGDPFNITAESPPDHRTAAIAGVAARLGKSETWVRERDMLSRLAPKVRKMVEDRKLPLAKAVIIARLADHRVQEDLARASEEVDGDTVMTLEALRCEVAGEQLSLGGVPWKLDVPIAGCVACSVCPNNSVNNRGLFEVTPLTVRGKRRDFELDIVDGSGAAFCLNAACYRRKNTAATQLVNAAAKKMIESVRASAKAAKGAGLGKAERMPVTERSVVEGGFAPKIEPSAVVRIVKDELRLKETKPAAAQGRSRPDENPPKVPRTPSVEEEATKRWEAATEEWKTAAVKLLTEFVRAAPGRRTLLGLIRESSAGRPWQSTYWGPRTAKVIAEQRKMWNAPRLLAAFARLVEPSMESVIALEADSGEILHHELPPHLDGLEALARTCGLADLGEAPTLEAARAAVQSEWAKKAAAEKPASSDGPEKKTTRDVVKSGRKKKSVAEAERELDAMAAKSGAAAAETTPEGGAQ